ncbi:uncharacterized protein LOC128249831 isoform X1 [Octopus bimaculoides]|uniref:uncharacterized protein LOC128249831 isoform X1 n=1 Tax=Octopus bimaculoides TaxID=37653 RepID=UPI0022E2F49F|nr:uncharacterized protein LOC128249831 isoform X1 [Octopus bimaculoides]
MMKLSLFIFFLFFDKLITAEKRCDELAQKYCVKEYAKLTVPKLATCEPYLEFLRCFDLKDEPCFNYYKNKYDCGAIMGKIDSSNQTKMSFLSAIATVFVGILLTYN